MADIVKRIESWDVKFDTERVKQVLDRKRERMFERYAAAMTALWDIEVKTKQTLDQAGVSTSLYVPYLDFARQLYKLSRVRRISGNSFAEAAQVLLDKWAARGMNPDVLSAIRTQVFDANAPTP